MKNKFNYCSSLTQYKRFPTREVKIGNLPLGGNNPIRIQSMTTTDTMDTIATVEQTIRMVDAGCEYVRITAPSINEANNLQNIKDELKKRGYDVPLIADIHFTPNAAEAAARIVEKVRINPGNYIDKKKFQQIEYTDDEYTQEIERIRERITPLVEICKEHGTAMRIGTNHGSLSDRIMSRYGDTPLGMVESALEFLRICVELNYYDIVLSMKASNTQVMVQAYRLLLNKMQAEGMDFPIHLGVTEAGDGGDGRIKSAVGISSLLEDGIGDTIRVSLTEEPEAEVPVAISLVNRTTNRKNEKVLEPIDEHPFNPFEYNKRESIAISNIGGSNVPKVIIDFSDEKDLSISNLADAGYIYVAVLDKWKLSDQACDIIFLGDNIQKIELPQGLKPVYHYNTWKKLESKTSGFPLFTLDELKAEKEKSFILNFVSLSLDELNSESLRLIKKEKNVVIVLETLNENAVTELRRFFVEIELYGIKNPVIIKRSYSDNNSDLLLNSASELGSLLIDGFGDGIWIDNKSNTDIEFINRTSFGILQATRTRISKTEYIACPSCGRTLFDLVEVTNQIRNRTHHLKGVKIGIMGCIVNGPGEMADADYGYVGSGVGKITLYRGKEVVTKSIDSEFAVDKLIDIIKEDGNWTESSI